MSKRKATDSRSNALSGTLDLLVPRALAFEPLHGAGIVRRIQQLTADEIEPRFGSLFPAVYRMEERGWLQSEWKASENNRRAKYYRLTAAGRRRLQAEEREWKRIAKVVTLALRSSS
jgi:PadR family transcriptional regulator, regulatory protein PadR